MCESTSVSFNISFHRSHHVSSQLNRLLALLIITSMSCSATAQAPSNVQSPIPVLTLVQQQVTVGTLLCNLDTTEQVYYYVTNDGPVLAGVNNTIMGRKRSELLRKARDQRIRLNLMQLRGGASSRRSTFMTDGSFIDHYLDALLECRQCKQ